MAAAAAASSSAAVPPADAAGHADDYQVNDIIQVKIRGVDKRFSQLHASYHCLIIATSPTHITFHPLYWSTDIYTIRRGHAKVRPLQPSDALSAYTGPPERKIAQIRSAVLPPLPPVATHSHHLQRFAFDFLWSCSECGKETGASEAQAYSCLPCHYDLCVDCFVAQGGVDTHPLPCVAPPAKRLKFEDYSKITFVDELKELECPSCLSTVCRPPNLLCGHLYCRGCLYNLRKPRTCPECRVPFDLETLHPLEYIQRQIRQKKVRCLNHLNGCTWIGELGADEKNLADHMAECNQRHFACPRCHEMISSANVKAHAEEECKVLGKAGKSAPERAQKRKRVEDAEEEKEIRPQPPKPAPSAAAASTAPAACTIPAAAAAAPLSTFLISPASSSSAPRSSSRPAAVSSHMSAASAAAAAAAPMEMDDAADDDHAKGSGGAISDGEEDDQALYCLCRQSSYGDMVACENRECAKEWFHFGCVGLTKTPTGPWVCQECKERGFVRRK